MDIAGMIEALQDPQTKHAIMVHMPIALSVLGILLGLLAAIMGKNKTMTWIAVGAYLLLGISAYLATESGEDAQNDLNTAITQVNETVQEHEEMAEKVWIFAVVTAGLFVVGGLTKTKVRIGAMSLGVISTLATAGWLAQTAHYGGELVYSYGAGTPNPVRSVAATPDGEPDGDGDEAPVDDPRMVHFREKVKPVLIDNCIKCHNPQRMEKAADLDQTTMAGMLKGGWGGPAVVPGNPGESWLLKAVRHEEDLEMPPKKDKLSDEIIADLEKWIQDGAVWEALNPPAPSSVTDAAPATESE